MSLILKRSIGEAIVIDHDVRVELIQLDNGQTALKIDAPHHIDVNREEIERKRQQSHTAHQRGGRGNYLQRRQRVVEGNR